MQASGFLAGRNAAATSDAEQMAVNSGDAAWDYQTVVRLLPPLPPKRVRREGKKSGGATGGQRAIGSKREMPLNTIIQARPRVQRTDTSRFSMMRCRGARTAAGMTG